MQFKVYRGSAGVVFFLLSILALIFFMLPAVLVFLAIATLISLLGGITTAFLGKKPIRTPEPLQQRTTGQTIDVAAEIE